MGILPRPAEIVRSLPLPKGFAVCDLGNQFYRAEGGKRPAGEWYASLGAGKHVSIDANGQATYRANLNCRLGYEIPDLFDLVTDFGTGEHIFNQAQVWETLHDLCKPGGYIVVDRPKQGWPDHGFYNIHDTLIRDLAHANAYALVHVQTHVYPGHGELLLAVMRKMSDDKFRYPNQGKYKAMLAAAEPVLYGGTAGGGMAAPKRIKRGDVLIDLIRQNGWTRGAEIGVLDGRGVFFLLLDACPNLELIAVDRWSATDSDYGDLTNIGIGFRSTISYYPGRAHVLEGDSAAMAEHVPNASLDFVFIDASHDYESVKADIAAWTPKVKPGGALLGHDWDTERFPGVIKAVTERFGGERDGWVQLFDDHVWGVRV